MNKTTEALKLALETADAIAKANWKTWEELATPEEFERWAKSRANHMASVLREALAEPVCEHRIADARNEFVKGGYICIKCGALFRAADHNPDATKMVAEPVKQEPVAYVYDREIAGIGYRKDVAFIKNVEIGTDLYAAPVDAKAIRAEALEEAAKVCDAIEQDRWNLYKGRPPYTGSEAGRADPHEQGVSMGAGECAAAIRGLK